MRRWILLSIFVVIAGLATWWLRSDRAAAEPGPYDLAPVERGDIEALVSATGTLSAQETVQVGTQVSGTIARVLVDFNQKVHQGELLAVIDTDLLDASVREAQAALDKGRAELAQAEAERDRNQALYAQGIVSENGFGVLQTSVAGAKASVASLEAALQRARTNRRHAEIRSPVDGVVIERAVDPGQTVAASLSSPKLFLIARDLDQMEILVDVDESDIGQIRNGQPARFTVASYPDTPFEGVVRQIRLQPQVIQDVVNYTVVVAAANRDGLLLPGMTATVDFVVEQVRGVLEVPAAALRFRPTTEMVRELRVQRKGAGATRRAPASGLKARDPTLEERPGSGPPAGERRPPCCGGSSPTGPWPPRWCGWGSRME